jgi:hypothetical protein
VTAAERFSDALVATAPPLSAAQRDRLAAVWRPRPAERRPARVA